MILKCQNMQCGRLTTDTEANQRVVNQGRCGECNGALAPQAHQVTAADTQLNIFHTRDNG
jgi:hypothetical protein